MVRSNVAYIGSKLAALDAIEEVLVENLGVDGLKGAWVLDAFSGTGIVGMHLNRRFNCAVLANDTERYASVIARALLKCPCTPAVLQHVAAMGQLPGKDGPLVKEFAEVRKFFTVDNARRLQASRNYIDRVECSSDERAFLLASLLTSIDRVANTTSVYASFLKEFKKPALKSMQINPIHTDEAIPQIELNGARCGDANTLTADDAASSERPRIAFLDPPYVNRQYSSYYSPFNVIVSNDTSNIRGAGAITSDAYISNYAIKRRAIHSFKQLIGQLANGIVDHVMVTYGSYGIMSATDMKAVLAEAFGSVKEYDVANRKFKSEASQQAEVVAEKWFFASKTTGDNPA